MAQINDIDTGHEARYETPTFDPRGAFAWTLRSGEIALRQRRREQGRLPHRDELTSTKPDAARRVNGTGTDRSAARRYETPTFDPRSAFARTLRSGEIARIAREQRPPSPSPLDMLLGAV
jgi:hypothetical protein